MKHSRLSPPKTNPRWLPSTEVVVVTGATVGAVEVNAVTGEAAVAVPTEVAVAEVEPSLGRDTPQTHQNLAVTAITLTEIKLSTV